LRTGKQPLGSSCAGDARHVYTPPRGGYR